MTMKKPGRDGTFLICVAFNALINFHWTIPAWILLVLHFVLGISIWWFIGVLIAWFAAMVLMSLFLMVMDRAPKDSGPSTQPDPELREALFEKSRAIGERDARGRAE